MMPAHFWWYPNKYYFQSTGLTQPITDLQEQEVRVEQVADTGGGTRYAAQYLGWRQVNIRSEKINDLTDARALEAITNHLANRHVIAFAEEDSANFGGYASVGPSPGQLTFQLRSQMWANWGPSNPVAGDVHVLIGPPGEDGVYRRDEVVLDQDYDGSGTLTYSDGPRNDYSGSWCLVRDKRFHPYLRLRQDGLGRQLLSHDRRITWLLDLPLEEVPGAWGPGGGGGGAGPGGGMPIDGQWAGNYDVEIPANSSLWLINGPGYGLLS